MRKIAVLAVLVVFVLFAGCKNDPDPDAVYKVTYFDNGSTYGFPPVDRNQYTSGMDVTVLDHNTLSKAGFTFKCWNTNRDGTGASYAAGDTIKITDRDVFLYAIWEPAPLGN